MSDYITPWSLVVGFVVILFFSFIMFEVREMARVTLFGSSNKTGVAFDATRDIPSLVGKVVLITGAAGDLGRQTAVMLARHGRPARIYIADLPRDELAKKAVVDSITSEAYDESNESKGSDAAAPKTEVRFLELDLTSFESVRACAAEFVAKENRLDILLLNAGIIRVATGTTKEGYEVHFGLNYLGHALLSKLLVPTMVRTAQEQPGANVRIVTVSSEGHVMAPKGGVQFEKLKTACADLVRYPHAHLELHLLGRLCANT
jgi:retinol dehydrogenase-12